MTQSITTTPAIQVWSFSQAPKNLRDLSHHGGDEDWVVFVPTEVYENFVYMPSWLERIDTCQDPQVVHVEGGVVYIGAHA